MQPGPTRHLSSPSTPCGSSPRCSPCSPSGLSRDGQHGTPRAAQGRSGTSAVLGCLRRHLLRRYLTWQHGVTTGPPAPGCPSSSPVPWLPGGVCAARPRLALAVAQALLLAVRQFAKQSLTLPEIPPCHCSPSSLLEVASAEILPVLSQNWEKYHRFTCMNESRGKSSSCAHSRRMQVYFL